MGMGRVLSFLIGCEFCLIFLSLGANRVLASGGTEVGNGAAAYLVSYDEVAEVPLHWMCFAQSEESSIPKTYASDYFSRRTEAKNDAFDRCSADHEGQSDDCVFNGCTYSVR